ncbi:caspase-9 [Pelobates fuscus]|uniref:caspase-9 n=1 Tax=Pelobates fuscus TaxID=191477 RepID=UPI002FE4C785
MDELHRQILTRNRVRLVTSLQVADLWDPLLEKGVFTGDMIEEIRSAGTRRDQARQLLIDLETRGSQAFPLFIQCLKETGQHELARHILGKNELPEIAPAPFVPNPDYIPQYPNDIPSKKENIWDIEQDYPMKFEPCGFCLIVNNMEFDEGTELSYRKGSDIDRRKLENRFRSFHFEVLVKNNLKGSEIYQELQDLAAKDHSKRDCCLVVILSHGCETRHRKFPGGVFGTDGIRIPVEKIVSYFDGTSCPTLRGKPKLFFIQACGGDQKDRGFEVDSGSPSSPSAEQSLQCDATAIRPEAGDMDETDAVASLPTFSDILVSYSTFPGFVSWRDKVMGTWYVETLDEILGSHAGTLDLQNLLLRVANKVSSKGTYKQSPGYFNFLRKRFFFRT